MTVQENVSLAPFSTLHVGGAARYFTKVATMEDLRAALSWAEEKGLPWFPLGGGANFFCRDEGYRGLVMKIEAHSLQIPNSQFPISNDEKGEVTAEAGVITRVAVLQAVEHGLRGIEHLAGIPGTIGGAVRGNAGAFGVETKDFLTRVRVLRRTPGGWAEDVLPRAQLDFAYRDSTFKRAPRDFVVWSATFSLPAGDGVEGERLVAEDLAERKAKQPYEFPSVGSIFKNPPSPRLRGAGPSSDWAAGKLIESVGLKGYRVGGAQVSEKHGNFIVNRGGAAASDVLTLIAEAKKRVFDVSGIALAEEIVVL